MNEMNELMNEWMNEFVNEWIYKMNQKQMFLAKRRPNEILQ